MKKNSYLNFTWVVRIFYFTLLLKAGRQANMQENGQRYRKHSDLQTDMQTGRQTYRNTDRHGECLADIEAGRCADS
jgi:hypothetical protein